MHLTYLTSPTCTKAAAGPIVPMQSSLCSAEASGRGRRWHKWTPGELVMGKVPWVMPSLLAWKGDQALHPQGGRREEIRGAV